MDKEEIKVALRNAVSSLIKDEPDAFKTNLHDVLAAKLRDRVNPPATEAEAAEIAAEADAAVADEEAAEVETAEITAETAEVAETGE